MANMLSEFYVDELTEWNRSIVFYNEELDELEEKLGEIIHRNTVPHIAEKVDAEQKKMNVVSEKFYWLQARIQLQEESMFTDEEFIDDTLVDQQKEDQQAALRLDMQQSEKEYVDTKYAIYTFISDTLRRQRH